MNDLRTAAQQALEALLELLPDARDPNCGGYDARDVRQWRATAGALRAALAQQAEPVAERERIASQWDGCVTHRLDTFGPVDIGASIRAGELVEPAQQAEPWERRVALAEQLQMQQAEPVEPVAWRFQSAVGGWAYGSQPPLGSKYPVHPLYAAPPQRLPLTAFDLRALYDRHAACQEEGPETSGWWDFARAVEKAVWEKTHGQA